MERLKAYSRPWSNLPSPCARYWDFYAGRNGREWVAREQAGLGNNAVAMGVAAVGDATPDGVIDGAAEYSCVTNGSAPPTGLFFFDGRQSEPLDVAVEPPFSEGARITAITFSGGQFVGEALEYDGDDPTCCPSITSRFRLEIVGGRPTLVRA